MRSVSLGPMMMILIVGKEKLKQLEKMCNPALGEISTAILASTSLDYSSVCR